MNTSSMRLTSFVLALLGPGCAVADVLNLEPLRGYLDVALAASDAKASALQAGTGKLRYGDGQLDLQPVLSEAHLVASANLGVAWRVVLDIKYDDEQRYPLDIGEAYLSWRSAPRPNGLRWRMKLGSFLPPFSLENTALGWSSPVNLSSSALNAWIGEEFRINGAEARLLIDRGEWRYSVAGAGYLANDAAGTLIALRGFAIHDRELGLFDRMRIPHFQLPLINPRGPFRAQSRFYEPLHEIDGRPGFYTGVTASNTTGYRYEFYYYDNNADPEALNRTAGQYAWRTRYWVAGLEAPLPGALHFTTQVLHGDTAMGRRSVGAQTRGMDMDYFTGYGRLTRAFATLQVSLRGEYFEVRDNDDMRRGYDNAESGYAGTLTLSHALGSRGRLLLETQYIEHERPVRVLAGEPRRFDEWLVRLNLRLFL